MRLIHAHLYLIFATLALLIAGISWFNLPAPAPVANVRMPVAEEPWSLPEAARNDSQDAMATIKARNLWGVVEEEDAAKEPEWHVLGIVRSGKESFILIAFDDQPVTMLKVGDALPDGAKIVQIEKDRFFVMTADKKRLVFGIYKNDQAK
jgi:hypothetical protein